MVKIRRIICIIIVICAVLSINIYGAESFPFTDVTNNSWYRSAVQYVYDVGIMSGTASDTFSPNLTTTRGMIVTILHRIHGKPAAEGNEFSDVAPDAYYAEAISWASEAGIVNGYGGGYFGPNDPITREQMASIFCRYTDYCGYQTSTEADLSRFSDRESISGYAVDSVEWAVAEGLISGMGEGILAPQGFATRAQVATIITRYMVKEFIPKLPDLGDNNLGWA